MLLTTHIPNVDSNDVVDLVDYHVITLPQFEYIVDKIGRKGNFGGWLSVRMKLGEHPFICLGQYEAIFKQYIFINKICTHKGKCKLVIKYEGYGIMILAFQS